ncbi:fungal specific transcription factor domain-containing protein [Colletotrichum paranaense]|uniref:Fungal specific transcription factor domain-containing protein n=1 Tax=Colletotrichum paranaense TaxID=1914294 RepID=A0ABQ9SLE6_9PEZI|nr:fungal specific transcription factor domain-containing protein [Colletotrichum paranaense]KAK1540346.1 fungal specific transcription factor domain-containing protein [Colletotrichum paranaense]
MQQQQPEQIENSSRASRLPVNPRRHKVAPEQRKRVATACNSCNVRRIKCSGERPCRQCRSSSRECQYPTVIEKVSVARNDLDDLRRKLEIAERALQIAVPDDVARRQLLQQDVDVKGSRAGSAPSLTPPEPHDSYGEASNEIVAETADGRTLHDQDGRARFLGETSGATFLDYLKEFMSTVLPLAYNPQWLSPTPTNGLTFLSSLGSYQTYDSRPIEVESNVDPLSLPSRDEMAGMLADLRNFIQDGNSEFPCGGIYWWGDLSQPPPAPTVSGDVKPEVFPSGTSQQVVSDNYRHLAFYHTAFAVACQANTTASSMLVPKDLSQIYFARARLLLGNPLDITRYTISDVAVLALMGFYLIEMNRRDAAYVYVSNAMHISIMHGAHRGWVDERGKRVFWTLYILDRWLSCLMGRPPIIMDDAIRLPLPCDDLEKPGSLPPAAGLRAHVELARISGHIVCNTYRVAPWDRGPGGAARHIDRALQLLGSWQSSLPPTLQMSTSHPSSDPSCCLLHMAYNQLLILVVRPIFFAAVKKTFAERYITSDRRWEFSHHADRISSCSKAAHGNLYLARWLMRLNGGTRKFLQAGLHYIFNAAIILMLEELLVFSPATEPDDINVNFAISVFEEEAKTESNYARDCATVLKDLQSIVQRLRLDSQAVYTARAGGVSGGPSTPGLTSDDVTNVSSSINTPSTSYSQQSQHQTFPPGPSHVLLYPMTTEDGPIYEELVAWVEHNDAQLYSNNYSI